MSDKIELIDVEWSFNWAFHQDNCDICRLPLTNLNIANNESILIGKCKHVYHKKCINEHLKNSSSCPNDLAPWIKERELN